MLLYAEVLVRLNNVITKFNNFRRISWVFRLAVSKGAKTVKDSVSRKQCFPSSTELPVFR
jgi:hypothetical protein